MSAAVVAAAAFICCRCAAARMAAIVAPSMFANRAARFVPPCPPLAAAVFVPVVAFEFVEAVAAAAGEGDPLPLQLSFDNADTDRGFLPFLARLLLLLLFFRWCRCSPRSTDYLAISAGRLGLGLKAIAIKRRMSWWRSQNGAPPRRSHGILLVSPTTTLRQ